MDHIPQSLNPLVNPDRWCHRIAHGNIFEPLVMARPLGGTYPHLAAKVEFRRGGRIVHFVLRSGIKFHDGRLLSSADVKFTLEAILGKRSPAPLLRVELSDILEVLALGAETVELVLKRPNYLILSTLADVGILPSHLYGRWGLRNARLSAHPVGTGPFRVQERKESDTLTLVRNDDYWGEPARAPRIEIVASPDPSRALARLKNNELDLLTNLYHGYYPDQVSGERFKRRFRVLRLHPYRMRVMIFNTRRPPLKDRRVRLALIRLADRERMVRAVRNGLGQVLSGPLWPLSPWYNRTLHPYSFDRRAAARLLDAAGWRARKHRTRRLRMGWPLTLTILQAKESEQTHEAGQILKQELLAAGIAAEIKTGDFGFVRSRLRRGDFSVALLGLALRPEQDLSTYFHTQGRLNHAGHSNQLADTLLEAISTTPGEEARVSLARRLHRVLHEEPPLAVLYTPIEIMVAGRRVRGLANNGCWPRLVGLWVTASPGGRR